MQHLKVFSLFAFTALTILNNAHSLDGAVFVEPASVVASIDMTTARDLCRFDYSKIGEPVEMTGEEYMYLYKNRPNDPKMIAYNKWVKKVQKKSEDYTRCIGKTVSVDYFDLTTKSIQKMPVGVGEKHIPGLSGREVADLLSRSLSEFGIRTTTSKGNANYLLRTVVSEIKYGTTGNSSNTESLMMFGYLGGRKVEEFGSSVRMDISLVDKRSGRYLFTLPTGAEATQEFVTSTALGPSRTPTDEDENFPAHMIMTAMKKAISDAATLIQERAI